MKLIGSKWTSGVNMLFIECDCGYRFYTRADRWKVSCDECGKESHLGTIREKYLEEGK